MIRINNNTIHLSFEKEVDDWFAVVPEWEGLHSDLQMVSGADVMCDILAQGENLICTKIIVDTIPQNYKVKLIKIQDTPDIGGAYYLSHWSDEFKIDPFQIWLCEVTEFVFGNLPDIIYIQ